MRYLGWMACIVTLISAPSSQADKIAWRVQHNELFWYKITNQLPPLGKDKKRPPTKDGSIWRGFPHHHWGATYRDLGVRARPFVGRLSELPMWLATGIPGRNLSDRPYKFRRMFEELKVGVKGSWTRSDQAQFAGQPALELRLSARLAGAKWPEAAGRLIDGQLSGRVYYHESRGHVLGGYLEVHWRTTTDPTHAIHKGKPLHLRYKFEFSLLHVLKLDGHRMQKLINAAIDKGAKYLLSKQLKDGSWDGIYTKTHPMGQTALITLTLMVSGIPAKDPRIVKALAYLSKQPHRKTYDDAVMLMTLLGKYAPAGEALERMTQAELKKSLNDIPNRVSKTDRKRIIAGVTFLLGRAKRSPVELSTGGNPFGTRPRWSYPSTKAAAWDNSNGQYAVLGLLAADRAGVKIPPHEWELVAKHWLRYQSRNGPKVILLRQGKKGQVSREAAEARGWSYSVIRPSSASAHYRSGYGSMTCAGVGSLAICRNRLLVHGRLDSKLRIKLDEGIRDGWAWLQKFHDVRQNPFRGTAWHLYYLYGLERAGVLADRKHLGRLDWYLDGAGYLISHQRSDGSWMTNYLRDTCFALLFLKRGTLPLEQTGGK